MDKVRISKGFNYQAKLPELVGLDPLRNILFSDSVTFEAFHLISVLNRLTKCQHRIYCKILVENQSIWYTLLSIQEKNIGYGGEIMTNFSEMFIVTGIRSPIVFGIARTPARCRRKRETEIVRVSWVRKLSKNELLSNLVKRPQRSKTFFTQCIFDLYTAFIRQTGWF